jgi:type II secretory pathway pseudopilin PulG
LINRKPLYPAVSGFCKSRSRIGFTVLELFIVIAIIGILVVLFLPNISFFLAKADRAVCTQKLRGLYTAFSGSLNDGDGWPQVPKDIQIGSLDEQQWWLDFSTNNLDLKVSDWQCPTISRYQKSSTNSSQKALICYWPTLFDSRPMSPKTWPKMPWFTEFADAHGQGNLCVRPDGSVGSAFEVGSH